MGKDKSSITYCLAVIVWLKHENVIVITVPTPCGRRIMLGTRAAMHSITAEQALPTLRKMLIEIFPSLIDVEISHCWTGFTGFSFSHAAMS